MLLHCTTWWEALAAEVTPIWLLPYESMRNHQCFGKRTLDQSNPEWKKVTCVRTHVYLQKCSAMELLVAVLTIVLFLALHLSRMCAQMLSQVVLAAEHASTHLQANACKLLRCITKYLCECTPSIKTDIMVTQQLQNRHYCQLYWHRPVISLPDMGVRGVGCHHTLSGSRGAPGGTCGWTVSCSGCMNMASVLQQYLIQVMCDDLQQQEGRQL